MQGLLETAQPAQTSRPCLGLVSSWTSRGLVLSEEISAPSHFWLSHSWEALSVQGSLSPMAPRLSSRGGPAQHNLQPGSLEGWELPHPQLSPSSECCLGQELGPEESRPLRTLVPWRQQPLPLLQCHSAVEPILQSLLYPSLPTPALSFYPSPYRWCVGMFNKTLLKKGCIYILYKYICM